MTEPATLVEDFVALARDTVDDLLQYQPTMATELGDHRYDDRLDDLRPAALEGERRMVADRLAKLRRFESGALPVAFRVDAEVLDVRLQRRLFDLDELREQTWNPLLANPGTALYTLLARDFAPLPDRLQSLAGRLSQLPEQLEAARAALVDMPRVHVETAIDQFGGTLHLLSSELPARLDEVPALRSVVVPVSEVARAAVEDHLDWLRGRLDGAAGNPRLGRDPFARKLALVLDIEMTPEEVLDRALTDLAGIEAELTDVAARFARDAGISGGVREVLDQLGDDAPTNATIVELARDAMEEAADFVAQQALVTSFDDPVEIIVMPEIHRGNAVAYCDAPGPLDPPDSTTFFAISPTPAHWSVERVQSFYREYNAHLVRNLVVHEAMPGHVLQLGHGRRSAVTTKVRQAFTSGPFVEGWAVYAEAAMAEAGFGGPALRVQQLKMQLRTAINTVLDVRVHCDELSQDDAMALMLGRGFQEEGEAAGKWRRALMSSAQLSTYHVGYLQVRDISRRLAAARPDASVRERHDAILAHGSPPPRHLPALLGLA